MSSASRPVLRGVLPVLLAAALWGTTGTAASFAPPDASALAVGAVTMGGGGLLLALLAGRSPGPLLRAGRPVRLLVAVGAVMVAAYPLAFYPAMSLSGVAVGTVVAIGSSPVFAALIERVLDGTRLNARWGAATALAGLGAALLVAGHGGPEDEPIPAGATAAGLVLALAAGASYAGYSYAAARLMRSGMPPRAVMGTVFGGGAVLLLPVVALTGGALLGDERGLVVAGYLVLVPMALAYVLFGAGLARLPASRATVLSLLEPVVAAVLSVLVVGEHLDPVGWAGVAAVLGGLLLLDTGTGRARSGRGARDEPARTGSTPGDG